MHIKRLARWVRRPVGVRDENADGAPYADAVSEYDAPGRDGVREVPAAHVAYFGSRLNCAFDQR
ncbi:hypothetical protein [Streptomyces phaeochromogenes]|uniref:hypothetical protein n=1 Tax=Streptomyces phaeochromogenes TaxID=1923 RepID=UPI0038708616|nr:hypothetical protein OHB08_50495 [Streptomyces phaeochromogenes]